MIKLLEVILSSTHSDILGSKPFETFYQQFLDRQIQKMGVFPWAGTFVHFHLFRSSSIQILHMGGGTGTRFIPQCK